MATIKAVIWDVVGVYLTDARREVMETIGRYVGRSSSQVSEVLTQPALFSPLKTGKTTFLDYLDEANRLLGLPTGELRRLKMEEVWFSKYVPRDGMGELLDEVAEKGRINIALSNNFRELVAFLDREYKFLKHFKECVWSYDVGLLKPAQGMYYAGLNAAGCKGYQCLYFDDKERNLRDPKDKLQMDTCLIDPKMKDIDLVRVIRDELRERGIRVARRTETDKE